jgi:hypothetical protein
MRPLLLFPLRDRGKEEEEEEEGSAFLTTDFGLFPEVARLLLMLFLLPSRRPDDDDVFGVCPSKLVFRDFEDVFEEGVLFSSASFMKVSMCSAVFGRVSSELA